MRRQFIWGINGRSVRPNKLTGDKARALKVDVTRIGEWEQTIREVEASFTTYNRTRLIRTFNLLTTSLADTASHVRGGYDRFDDWHSLLGSKSYSKPSIATISDLIRDGALPYSLVNMEFELPSFERLIDRLGDYLGSEVYKLEDMKKPGVTSSSLVALFTSHTHVDTVACQNLLVDAARKRLNDVMTIRKEYLELTEFFEALGSGLTRINRLKARLDDAYIKRDALIAFEKKYGSSFAKSAAMDKASRSRAVSVKKIIRREKECPYCAKELHEAHLDHIYPVSRGGLSTVENLVWCCAACNLVKGDKGLMEFVIARGLEIESVVKRLHTLGKRV